MNIENDLKQLNNLKVKTPDSNFQDNLKKRLLNEYEGILSEKNTKSTFFDELFSKLSFLSSIKLKPLLNKGIGFLRYQSALNLSVFFLLIFSFGAIASYIAMPSSIRDKLANKNNGELNVLSNVEGADIYINGEYVGTTPLEQYDLKEGNYSVRIEKEGFVVFSGGVEVAKEEESEVLAELLPDKYKGIYESWLDYQNPDLGFVFKYPPNWEIVEDIGGNNFENFGIEISQDGSSINFVVNSTDDQSFKLMEDSSLLTYKRILDVNSREMSRYLQFDAEGNFVQGGLYMKATDEKPAMAIFYKLNGTEEEVMNSDLLLKMDRITQSAVLNDPNYSIAIDKEDENVKVDLKEELVTNISENVDLAQSKEEKEGTSKIEVTKKSPKVAMEDSSQSYTNNAYGYSLSYPKNWDLSASRADYPVENRGEEVTISGRNLEVARLKIKMPETGRFYILITNEEVSYLSDSAVICSNGNHFADIENYSLVKSNGGTYDYQICQGNNGVFTFDSAKNGIYKYSIVMIADSDEMDEELVKQIDSVVNSLNFNQQNVDYVFKDIRHEYESNGLRFTYPYKWILREGTFDCRTESDDSDTACRGEYLENSKGRTMLKIIPGDKKYEISDYIVETSEFGTNSRVINVREFYEKECDEQNGCQKGVFSFGVYQAENVRIEYYGHITVANELGEIFETISLY